MESEWWRQGKEEGKKMIRTMLRINMGVLALFVFLWGNISAPFAFGELVKDPLKASVSQPQQERAELYVLTIDINGDGLNDALDWRKS
jgi:hypothetical protein